MSSNFTFDMYLSPSLWMGNLDEDMNEQFIKQTFEQLGEKIVTVKMMKSKGPGQAPYCFVEFEDVELARQALHRLNGKPIPNIHPVRLFKLNPASFGKEHQLLPEFSLHIGDLTPDVDDYTLYNAFAKHYPSVRGAKVVPDPSGKKSKLFGFVRFSEETDQQRALIEMQHMTGIGHRPIRVGLAAPKRGYYGGHNSQHDGPSTGSSYGSHSGTYPYPPYSHYGNYYSWGGYYHYSQHYQSQQVTPSHDYMYPVDAAPPPPHEDDMEVLEDPCLEVNVAKENKEFMDSSESFFEALDRSRWHAIDNIMVEVPVNM